MRSGRPSVRVGDNILVKSSIKVPVASLCGAMKFSSINPATYELLRDPSGLADRAIDFKLPTGRGDEFAHGGAGGGDGGDARDRPKSLPEAREIYVWDLHINTLKVKARNFH